MAKSEFTYGRRFNKKHLNLVVDAFSKMKTKKEIKSLILDLFTDLELEEMTRRLMAVEMFAQGQSYNDIGRELKMSSTTINNIYKKYRNSKGGFYKLFSEQ